MSFMSERLGEHGCKPEFTCCLARMLWLSSEERVKVGKATHCLRLNYCLLSKPHSYWEETIHTNMVIYNIQLWRLSEDTDSLRLFSVWGACTHLLSKDWSFLWDLRHLKRLSWSIPGQNCCREGLREGKLVLKNNLLMVGYF